MNISGILSRLLMPCLIAALLAASAAQADDPTTWQFAVATRGEDTYWTSPNAVDTTADLYDMSYEIAQVVVTVRYLFIEIDVDVTDQIPPTLLSGGDIYEGPPPIVMLNEWMVYPDPPEPPALEAHIVLWLDADGYGQASATDITFGTVEIPPWGVVEIVGVYMEGTVTVQPLAYYGDMDCDGTLDSFDIDPFVLALTDPAGYAAAYPDCDRARADCNQDGAVNAFDIDPFVARLTGG